MSAANNKTISRPGDVWVLGKHRLICGDASDKSVVTALMRSEKAHLLFTSPPYANQRNYTTGGIYDWDSLMQGVFGAVCPTLRNDAQILVNLGLIHYNYEWHPYWDKWIEWMRAHGWRRFGWYIWDKCEGLPGDWRGRLAPAFEFVFHFCKTNRRPNKIIPCKYAGIDTHSRINGTSTALRCKDGKISAWSHAGRPTQNYRIPDSVIRIMRQKGGIGKDIDHPAVFPVNLPKFIIDVYTHDGEIVIDPFSGSGTTIIAGEIAGRSVRAIEIAPEYVDVTLRRWLLYYPNYMPVLESSGQAFDVVELIRKGA